MTEQNPQPQPGYNQPQPGYYQPQPAKPLTRTPDDQMIAGVCGGLARYLNVDPTLVRVLAVVALFIGFPAVAVGYVVAWAIVPKA